MGYENRGKVIKEDLKRMYLKENMTFKEIGDYYGVTAQAVYRYVKKYDFRNKQVSGRKIYWKEHINENDDFVYLMGFMYADGTIKKNGNSSTIALFIAEKDKEHLIKLSNILPFKRKIYERKFRKPNIQTQYGFQMNGMDLENIVSKYGIVNRKSYNWTKPNISKDLLPHFLRGWFDGDGCVCIDRDKYLRISVTGNHNGMKYYSKSLKNLGYHESVKIYKSGKNYSRLVIHSIAGCKNFYEIINGNLRMGRKWDKIENWL